MWKARRRPTWCLFLTACLSGPTRLPRPRSGRCRVLTNHHASFELSKSRHDSPNQHPPLSFSSPSPKRAALPQGQNTTMSADLVPPTSSHAQSKTMNPGGIGLPTDYSVWYGTVVAL